MCVICFCRRQCTCYLYIGVWRDCYTNMSRQKTHKTVYGRYCFNSSLLASMGLALHSHEDNQTFSNDSSVSIIRLSRKLCGFSWSSFSFLFRETKLPFWEKLCGMVHVASYQWKPLLYSLYRAEISDQKYHRGTALPVISWENWEVDPIRSSDDCS